MEWLGSNWIWLALGIGALALMFSGRGGCGMGHGGHGHNHSSSEPDRPRETGAPLTPTPAAKLGPKRVPSIAADADITSSADQGVLAAEHAGHDSGPSAGGHQRHHHGC